MIRAAIPGLALAAALSLAASGAEKRSGYQDAAPETRALQDDDTANPGMLWVLQGETLWDAPAGSAGRSCAGCHGPLAGMRGAATRYPQFDPALGRPITLAQRIDQCRTERQGAPALPPESEGMLALSAAVAHQSRGLPLQVATDGPARPFFEAGRALFNTKFGQLNLACSQCHDQLAGQRLAGSTIPQGHPNGYPLYRLEWQALGSLGRRLRNCLVGVRAEPFPPGSPELVALELYLGGRASGLPIETPAVRP